MKVIWRIAVLVHIMHANAVLAQGGSPAMDTASEASVPTAAEPLKFECGADLFSLAAGQDLSHVTLLGAGGEPIAALSGPLSGPYSGGGWELQLETDVIILSSPDGERRDCIEK
ncbi:MAG: hypothetical protein H7X92_13270 [Chitinophagales bacterium]|nr:hypothetical protein [Hyphomicrobiales bacterium]